jgi:hypothetical protein
MLRWQIMAERQMGEIIKYYLVIIIDYKTGFYIPVNSFFSNHEKNYFYLLQVFLIESVNKGKILL